MNNVIWCLWTACCQNKGYLLPRSVGWWKTEERRRRGFIMKNMIAADFMIFAVDLL